MFNVQWVQSDWGEDLRSNQGWVSVSWGKVRHIWGWESSVEPKVLSSWILVSWLYNERERKENEKRMRKTDKKWKRRKKILLPSKQVLCTKSSGFQFSGCTAKGSGISFRSSHEAGFLCSTIYNKQG